MRAALAPVALALLSAQDSRGWDGKEGLLGEVSVAILVGDGKEGLLGGDSIVIFAAYEKEGIISRKNVLIDKTYANPTQTDHGNCFHLFCLGCCPGSHLFRWVCAGDSWWN